jgi:hypothetical protein
MSEFAIPTQPNGTIAVDETGQPWFTSNDATWTGAKGLEAMIDDVPVPVGTTWTGAKGLDAMIDDVPVPEFYTNRHWARAINNMSPKQVLDLLGRVNGPVGQRVVEWSKAPTPDVADALQKAYDTITQSRTNPHQQHLEQVVARYEQWAADWVQSARSIERCRWQRHSFAGQATWTDESDRRWAKGVEQVKRWIRRYPKPKCDEFDPLRTQRVWKGHSLTDLLSQASIVGCRRGTIPHIVSTPLHPDGWRMIVFWRGDFGG